VPKKNQNHKFPKCRICFRDLTGNKEQYCSDNCKQQHKQIKAKFKELKEKNPNLEFIIWKQKINKDKIPEIGLEWRNIEGIENKPEYKKIKNIVTKRKPKTKKKSGFSFNQVSSSTA